MSGAHTTLESQLNDLLELLPEMLWQDLQKVWAGRELPHRVRELMAAGAAGPAMVAEAIWEYWDAAIAPYWVRICGVLEDDVSHRAGVSLRGGLFDLLNDLHPEVSLSGHTLSIDKPNTAPPSTRGSC